MKLKYLKEQEFYDLYDSVDNNIEFYNNSDTSWVDDFFNNKPFWKESRIEINLPKLYCDGKTSSDIVNTRLIYDAFKDHLNPNQASNEYLWSYLSHTTYWEYTRQRWNSDIISSDTVKYRYFCGLSKSGKSTRIGLLRNSISRLFWYGYLTYQEGINNPYELTELLLSKTDLAASVVERNYSMNKNITLGILKAIKEMNDNQDEVALEEWRNLCKYLNRYGAVSMLDTLSSEEISNISYSFLEEQRKNWK